jgi:hypothetical protein
MWTADIEKILENIRVNALLLSQYHKGQYFHYKKQLKYFRIPVILISALASVFNVGLQNYIDQAVISGTCCIMSLIVGIIGSLEMYLQIQKKMENELIMSKEYYLMAIDIYKVLQLEPCNRNGEGIPFLEDKYTTYVKLFENSNLLENDKLQDELAVLPTARSGSFSSKSTFKTRVMDRFSPPSTPSLETNHPRSPDGSDSGSRSTNSRTHENLNVADEIPATMGTKPPPRFQNTVSRLFPLEPPPSQTKQDFI